MANGTYYTVLFTIFDIMHKLKNTSRMYSCINNVDIATGTYGSNSLNNIPLTKFKS